MIPVVKIDKAIIPNFAQGVRLLLRPLVAWLLCGILIVYIGRTLGERGAFEHKFNYGSKIICGEVVQEKVVFLSSMAQ